MGRADVALKLAITVACVAGLVLVLAACGQSGPESPASARTTAAPASSGAGVSAALTTAPIASPPAAGQGGPVSPSTNKQFANAPAMAIDVAKQYSATIATSEGSMTADLFAKDTPVTVNNFVFLARQGFYDGVPFHRILKGFMVQTGDPTGTGTGSPGYRFKDEPVTRKYERGTLAMANSGPNTNGSQFFIMHQDYALPPNYTIFGKLTDGLDTLDKLANTAVGPDARGEPSKPRTPPQITSVTIAEK